MRDTAELSALGQGSALGEGKYIIQSVLETDNFGITYCTWHAGLQKYYAVKEFFPSDYCRRDVQTSRVRPLGLEEKDFDRLRQQFADEARSMARLDHPDIARIVDVFEQNGSSYIVMPVIEGETLRQRVERKGRLPYDEAINYILLISQATDYIHQHNNLHRHITPDNLTITPQDQIVLTHVVPACDFIPAKPGGHSAIMKNPYAPLEQYSSAGRKGPYSDIYSLGAVFYFMLTGYKPMDAIERTVGTMPEPCELEPAVSPSLNRTIMKALSLRPEDRYQRVGEWIYALQNEEPSPSHDQPQEGDEQDIPGSGEKKTRMPTGKIAVYALIGLGVLLLAGVAGKLYKDWSNVHSDLQAYRDLVFEADGYRGIGDVHYCDARDAYGEAATYEAHYASGGNASKFDLGAAARQKELSSLIDSLIGSYRIKIEEADEWIKLHPEDTYEIEAVAKMRQKLNTLSRPAAISDRIKK